MTHTHRFKICKITGDLAHLCPDDCWEWKEYPHMQEPFATYKWTDAHIKPPEPTIPKASNFLSYARTGKLVSPFFFKGGIFLEPECEHCSEKDFQDAVDLIAKNDLANNIRVMPWWVEADGVLMPHRKVRGKYVLEENGKLDFNVKWLNQFISRSKYITDRNLFLRMAFNNQSWLRHFNKNHLNPDLNWGWKGKPLYPDRYGWTHYHWYQNRPDLCNEELAEKYATIGDYKWTLITYLVKLLNEVCGNMWGVDNNEVDQGAHGHDYEATELGGLGIPRRRRITSPRGEEWLRDKPSIARRWVPEMHGINTLALYEDAKQFEPSKPWLPSGDGFGENWLEPGTNEISKLLLKSLRDGNLGYTGNTEGKWDTMFAGGNPLLVNVAFKMRSTFRSWVDENIE